MAYYEYHRSNPLLLDTRIGEMENFDFPLHFHTSFELLCVLEGEIEVVVGKTTYRPQGGALVLIPPNFPHSYCTRSYSKISVLIFNANILPEIYEEMQSGIYRMPVITNGGALLRLLKEAAGNALLLRSALYRIAAAYAENGLLATAQKRNDDFAIALSEYLEEHCTEPLSEGAVAREMGYHPRYLSVLIRKNFGTSFCRLLNECRVRAACPLLRAGKRSITEVYLSVGFESQSSFNRNFKAIMDITPMEYRQGYRIGSQNHA